MTISDALAILKRAGAVLVPYPAPKGQRWPVRRWNLESARRFYVPRDQR